MKGIVKRVIGQKGFGFIRASNKEYFFHRDDFRGHWNDLVADYEEDKLDMEVEFEPVESTKGLRAENVRRTQFPNEAV